MKEIKKALPDCRSAGFEFSSEAVSNALCDDVTEANLIYPLGVDKCPDTLGLCLEVLEHIDDAHWKEVLSNMTRLCDVIIFSAALPGQGGEGHINCRKRIDWIKRFQELGWAVDLDATQHIVSYMKGGYHMGWFAANSMVLLPLQKEPYYYVHY